MITWWMRLGVRAQILVIVLIGTVLTTAVTLLIADTSIQNYATSQIQNQENSNLSVADLVLRTKFGPSVSISAQGDLVIDAPITDPNAFVKSQYGHYGQVDLNYQQDYVSYVNTLIGEQVSVFQCANAAGLPTMASGLLQCPQISTTLQAHDAHGNLKTIHLTDPYNNTYTTNSDVNAPNNPVFLPQSVVRSMNLLGAPTRFTGSEQIGGENYEAAYEPLFDPSGQHLIGVLSVAEPLSAVTTLIDTTTLELIVSGLVIMLAGIILSVLVASTISGTLRRASSQLGVASTQLTSISEQQAGGSRQQVWAINAINQALRNLQDTSTDVSRRTDQLAQIGTQVAMRRAEISPGQFESVMNYMTRSVRDISIASHQQTTTVERMASAMQAVVEIADQVASSSQQTSESAHRLDGVVTELEQLVTGRSKRRLRGRPMPGNMPRGDGLSPSGMPMRGSPSNMPARGAPGYAPMRGMPDSTPPRSTGGRYQGTSNSRPMLPSPRRATSRPNSGGPMNWDAMPGDPSSAGNYPGGASGQYPWPPTWEQERNY